MFEPMFFYKQTYIYMYIHTYLFIYLYVRVMQVRLGDIKVR